MLQVGNALKQGAEALFFFSQAMQIVTNALASSLQPFLQQEQAIFRMNLVLRNLGRGGEVERLVSFNREMAAMSGNTTASLSGLTALLVQFNLTEEEIRRATPVILDWSRAVGIESTRAADILGSALRNEKDAIQRYGVDIDLTRSRSEKLNQALEQLEARFKGGAQAAEGTLAGSLERTRNLLDEITASVNRASGAFLQTWLIPLRAQLQDFLALVNLINKTLERLGLLPPVAASAARIPGGAANAGLATEATAAQTAANTKKTADALGNFGRFVIGGGAAAQGALNIRGLNSALRAGR